MTEWLKSIISAMLVTLAADIFAVNFASEKESLKKSLKFVLGLFTVAIILIPLFKGISEFNIGGSGVNNKESAQYTATADELIIKISEEKLEKALKDKLIAECGIKVYEADIKLAVRAENEKSEVTVAEAHIYCDEGADEAASEKTFELLGVYPELHLMKTENRPNE